MPTEAAFCRACLRLPLADRQAALRGARRTARGARVRRGGRRGTVERRGACGRGAGAPRRRRRVRPGAGHPAPREGRRRCASATSAAAPASLRPPPAPRKKKRTRAPARDLAGARRTLGFGDSDEEVDSWTCRGAPTRTRRRQKPRWSRAPLRRAAAVAREEAPPATPSAVLMRGGRSPPPRTPGRVARSPAPRTPALASPAPPQTPAVTYGRPAGPAATPAGAADAWRAASSGDAETSEPPNVTQSALVCC